ncbi:MAG: hypothetical protein CM1200mP2_30990 [Planctomycetaceae bacterium]|nr:MAG: hypothetical protein CM1200mP2_30990 [Planctomycetaceae bacterium]
MVRTRFAVPGQVNLAETADFGSVGTDQDRAVEMSNFPVDLGEFGKSQVEPDSQPSGLVEQGLGVGAPGTWDSK